MIKKVTITLIMTILLCMLFFPHNIVQATSLSNIFGGADNFVNQGKTDADNTLDMEALNNASDLVYNTLLILGTCIAVIIAVVLGIQFITGSVEQKVKVKESLIPFVIGCVVIFGAFGIWRLVIVILR